MVGVDESEAEFAGLCDFANNVGFAAGVNAHSGNEIGNQLRNLETDRPGFVDDAMGLAVNGVDGDAGVIGMLAMDRAGDDGGGKSGERADLNYPARRENAHETR